MDVAFKVCVVSVMDSAEVVGGSYVESFLDALFGVVDIVERFFLLEIFELEFLGLVSHLPAFGLELDSGQSFADL